MQQHAESESESEPGTRSVASANSNALPPAAAAADGGSTAAAADGLPRWVPPCDGCTGPMPTDAKPLRCSRCRCAWYHDKKCQRAHYKEHKVVCRHWGACLAEAAATARAAGQSVQPVVTCGNNHNDWTNNDDCGICLGTISNGIGLECGHRFCHECLAEYQRAVEHNARCPFCRSTVNPDLLRNLYEDTAMLSRRAYRRPHGSEARATEYAAALQKADELLLLEPEHRMILSLKADILLEQQQWSACAAHIDSYFNKQHFEINGTRISPVAVQEVHVHDSITLVKCLIKLEHFDRAETVLQEIVEASGGLESFPAVQQRDLLYLFSWCFCGQGRYENAIDFGNAAVKSNRHYERVYEPIALSFERSGDLIAAIKTMQQAVIYETPWNPRAPWQTTTREHLGRLEAKYGEESRLQRVEQLHPAGVELELEPESELEPEPQS
jgi:tetratricopeptide (TPR) repeat protein